MEQLDKKNENVISVYDGVMLRKGTNLKYIKAKVGKKERMQNFSFQVDELIGKSFGTAYKVQGNKLIQTNPLDLDNETDDVEIKELDNREILDDNDSQKMSRDDIMKLKEEGVAGTDIIDKIVDNSSTFKEKNIYSKAKYLKKKKKKHLAYFITCKPTARLLSQLYFTKSPAKVLDIRPDTLAQILTWANIKSRSNILLLETCQGLILGSVLERLGQRGEIIQAYHGNCPVRIILHQFNFTEENKAGQVCGFSLENMEEIKQAVCENGKFTERQQDSEQQPADEEMKLEEEGSNILDGEHKKVAEKQNVEDDEITHPKETTGDISTEIKDGNEENAPCNKHYTKEKQQAEQARALVHLKKRNLDSLIIASKYHPMELMTELLPFIKPSAPIIIYCQYIEPLIECYRYLRDASLAINVHLTETWFRDIQVLPNRTHPGITMSARSGYLLRALKIKKTETYSGESDEPAPKKAKT